MNRYHSLDDNDSRRKGLWISVILHILLIFFVLIPCFNSDNKKEEDQLQGIMVAFGNPEAMRKTEVLEAKMPVKQTSAKSKAAPVKNAAPKAAAVPVKQTVSKTVVEESTVSAAEEKMRQQKAEEEARRKAEAEEEARRKAEEAARLEAERKAKASAKSKFSNLFKSGDSNSEASKGQEDGKPNASALDDLSRGTGKVGTGLGSRALLHAPSIQDNTQKTGRVIVNICVKADGHVSSAKFRQKGSTTTDAHLISLAEKSARKYVFSKSSVEEQCGDVIIDFKLR